MAYVIVDLETMSHPCAAEFIPKPDLDAIKAAGNLKDPEKIAADVEKRKAEAKAGYEWSLSRAALDWNLSQIVCIGYQVMGQDVKALVCRNDDEEIDALKRFWADAGPLPRLVGFNSRGFDVPTLIQRSRLLGVSHPHIKIGRFGNGDVIDIRDILTFDDARYEALMPRSLKAFARRFGLTVDDAHDGADVAQLVRADAWDDIAAHCTSDVNLTRQLALRIKALPMWKEVAA